MNQITTDAEIIRTRLQSADLQLDVLLFLNPWRVQVRLSEGLSYEFAVIGHDVRVTRRVAEPPSATVIAIHDMQEQAVTP
jgi:hypothetical protein